LRSNLKEHEAVGNSKNKIKMSNGLTPRSLSRNVNEKREQRDSALETSGIRSKSRGMINGITMSKKLRC
jgi:hypothetical protein